MNKIPVLNFALLDAPSARDVIQEVIVEDCYRMGYIPDGSIVIDGGAFYGEFGIACAMTKDCHVICIEPSPVNYAILEKNAPNNVVMVQAALADETTPRVFLDRPNHPAGSLLASIVSDVSEVSPHASVAVRCTTMPLEIERARTLFGLHPICLKIDIEGAEKEIFEADTSWLKDIHYVGMEWHSHDGHIYAEILKKAGFEIIALEGSGPPPRPAWDKSHAGGLLVAVRRSC